MENIEQRLLAVCNDRDHGSHWIVRAAISILYDIATESSSDESMQRLHMAARKLEQSHPAMAALVGATRRILNTPGGLSEKAASAARLLEEVDHAAEHIAANARPLLKGTLMTHSLSGTILDVLVACRAQIERVIVLEGRPRYEGRNMAQLLVKHGGLAVTLITDAQADIFLPQCQAVVVGADTVLANGDVINKAGTALVAWAARGHRVPMYVLCETLKISPRTWSGDLQQLEEKEAEEVMEQPIEGVTTRNFYFDRTVSRLIAAIITERGQMGRREIKQVVSSYSLLSL
jgi:translation initiation factor 2B subunit (eIF-2B alpha/beta/delta family)